MKTPATRHFDAIDAPRVDEANHCIRWGERRVELAPKAFLVLQRLMQQPNQIVSKNALLEAAWPDTHVTEGVLTLAINQLREAFGDDSRQPRFIETAHRRGYRWIGALAATEVSSDPSPLPDAGLFVGREVALAQLEQALARAVGGARQMVFVTGEPGIGKTTLIDQLVRTEATSSNASSGLSSHGARAGLRLPTPTTKTSTNAAASFILGRGQCADGFGTTEAYLPLLEALERLCLSSAGDDTVALLRRLAPTWMLQLPRLIAAGEQDELRRSLAGSTGDRMVRELLSFLEELAAERTLVLVVEDLHWSDHATMAALAALATRRERAHLLVIATYRPAEAIAQQHPVTKLKHELSAKRQCLAIDLDGLDPDAVGAYLDRRFPNHHLPREFASRLQAQTSGNPLFLLNALDDFVQRGWLQEHGDGWTCTVDLAMLAAGVPEGTREMIAFRVQQLSVADLDLLQAASVIGASFATQALAATLERAPAEIEVECTRLLHAAQFLAEAQHANWPDGSAGMQYAFRHTLYQQALYEGVTPARRQLLHRRVAQCLEKGFAAESATIASQLALHFERGAELVRAVPYRRTAAQRALTRYAYDQAKEHLRAALADLAGVPAGAERDAQELAIYAGLLRPMFATLSASSTELLQVIEQIRSLSVRGETRPALLESLALLAGHYSMSGDMRAARSASEQMLARAQTVRWGAVMARIARGVLGYCQVMLGDITDGVQNLESAIDIPDMAAAAPLDPGIIATKDAALGHCLLGKPSLGRDLSRAAMGRAAAAKHPPTFVHVVLGAVRLGVVLRDDELLEQGTSQIAALPEQFQARWEVWAEIARGFLACNRGDLSGADRILRGKDARLRAGTPFYQSLYALMATTSLLTCGRHHEADLQLDAAFTLVDETGERWCEAELHRLRAEIHRAARAQCRRASKQWQDLGGAAEECLGRALQVARSQGAKWWELRAAVSLARLLGDGDRAADARRQLSAVYGEFEDGFDLPDLREAGDLLQPPPPQATGA